MSALVKAQLLKHLSKFVKNLSADHLTLKLLQGAGDIENIELNEDLISSTIGLPPWLRLTRAQCNRMSIRLHWTRLTSEPISVTLDVVYVDIEAGEPDKDSSTAGNQQQQQASNSAVLNSFRMPYGFINKAVDGISIAINTIKVHFRAGAFFAMLELAHVTLQSCLPDWSKEIKHLKNTRIKNTVVKQVLLFKLAKCQTLRLETSEDVPMGNQSSQNQQHRPGQKLTPFRVIVNRLLVKIQFKRSLTDSSVLCTKLNCEVDDILSVLTDAQAQVGLRFINHLSKLSAGSSVEIAAKRAALARSLATSVNPDAASSAAVTNSTTPAATATLAYHKAHAYFINHDISEHSTHVKLQRVDLHLVAERASSCSQDGGDGLNSLNPILLEGAVRISLENLSFNLFPAHVLGSDYKSWPRYQRLFSNSRTNSENLFQGCFEAVAYGSIDAVKLYQANLPQEHNPNQLCISICGARKWPAVYFDSSQIVSEKDLTIVDSRNAVRISRVNVTLHLPTLLYLLVMVQDARELFRVAEELDVGSVANRCTKVELCEVDIVYKPTTESYESASSRPVILVSIANVVGLLVQRPEEAAIPPSFSDNADACDTELYSFLHSFLLPEQSNTATQSDIDFENRCSVCCSEIEKSHRQLWHWQFLSIFARTVTALDGDIPLLYLPKISGFMPHNMSSYKLYSMLKCDPIEGPIQIFIERSQFDDLQEMLQLMQSFASEIQRSLKILGSVTDTKAAMNSEMSEISPSQQASIVFFAPLISIRLLLPAVPPLVVPLTSTAATQTGEPSNAGLSDLPSTRYSWADSRSGRSTLPQECEEDERPLIPIGLISNPESGFAADSEADLTALQQENFLNSTMQTEVSPARTMSDLTLNTSLENVSLASQTISSSSSESVVDFVVVKSEDPTLADSGEETSGEQQSFPNPLDPNSMNFGLSGGAQEVVTVQLVIEGTTVTMETNEQDAFPKIELRFDKLFPINKPRVIARRDVYFPLDMPVSYGHESLKRQRRQYRAVISSENDDANIYAGGDSSTRQRIDFWLAPNEVLPSISMSAISALAHFISPDGPVNPSVPNTPPLIKIHSSSNVHLTMKLDTPSVYDRLPLDLIHFVPPPPTDKHMSVTVTGCPLLITQNGFDLAISSDTTRENDSSSQTVLLRAEVDRLTDENRRLKLRLMQYE